MSSTNKTPNYGLPQYIDTDKPTFLGDFNDAMGIIDKGMNDNKNSAGEGSNKMDEANARIGDAEETLTETQNQVDSISGLADSIETKVQTALTQANDAATKSGQANTNSTAAVNAANQASTDANAALQQAQGNVSQINGLESRVTALENDPQIKSVKVGFYFGNWATNKNDGELTENHFNMEYMEGYRVSRVIINFSVWTISANTGTVLAIKPTSSTNITDAYDYFREGKRPELNTPIVIDIPESNYNKPVTAIFYTKPQNRDYAVGSITYEFEKYNPSA